MGVKWLLHWQPGPGTLVSSNRLLDIIKVIESINATRTGRWQVSASHYRPNQRDQNVALDCARELLGVTFSDTPSKHFFVLRVEHIVIEADTNIQEIMEKLQTYRNRITLLFEGFQYQLGDFQIKVGKAILSHSENIRGIVMEVDYLPVSSLDKAKVVMQEFLEFWQDVISKQSLNGKFLHLEPNFADYSLSDDYTLQHTALQYISLMAYFMSQRS